MPSNGGNPPRRESDRQTRTGRCRSSSGNAESRKAWLYIPVQIELDEATLKALQEDMLGDVPVELEAVRR